MLLLIAIVFPLVPLRQRNWAVYLSFLIHLAVDMHQPLQRASLFTDASAHTVISSKAARREQ
jgi:hypothetical protein